MLLKVLVFPLLTLIEHVSADWVTDVFLEILYNFQNSYFVKHSFLRGKENRDRLQISLLILNEFNPLNASVAIEFYPLSVCRG